MAAIFFPGGSAARSAARSPDIFEKSLTLQGIYVGSRDDFEAMNRAVAQVRLRPVIDRVFPFEEAREAYQYLKSGAHFGKVVISFGA